MGFDIMYGEGSGTPLQYSCLANPMDGGAWPHERLTDLAVVPREKAHTGAAAREQPRDSPVIER